MTDKLHLTPCRAIRAADVAFAVAGAGATAAVVLWLTAPSEPAAAPAIVPVAGPGYVGVTGRF